MADPQEESEIERVIVAAIEKHARGDVEALARGIIEELRGACLVLAGARQTGLAETLERMQRNQGGCAGRLGTASAAVRLCLAR